MVSDRKGGVLKNLLAAKKRDNAQRQRFEDRAGDLYLCHDGPCMLAPPTTGRKLSLSKKHPTTQATSLPTKKVHMNDPHLGRIVLVPNVSLEIVVDRSEVIEHQLR